MSYIQEKHFKKIEQHAIGSILCKGGYVSTFSRKVAFGPQMYGDIAMRPLVITKLVQQVQAVLKHLRCPGENIHMLCITMVLAQLRTGMGLLLLTNPDESREKCPTLGMHMDTINTDWP
jgi:hypothetical protein